MILNYYIKDFNCLIELFIENKTILVYNNNYNKSLKLINKILVYLNYLGLIISNNYKIIVYVYHDKTKYKTMEFTQKIYYK